MAWGAACSGWHQQRQEVTWFQERTAPGAIAAAQLTGRQAMLVPGNQRSESYILVDVCRVAAVAGVRGRRGGGGGRGPAAQRGGRRGAAAAVRGRCTLWRMI